jgi:hypothetical protein
MPLVIMLTVCLTYHGGLSSNSGGMSRMCALRTKRRRGGITFITELEIAVTASCWALLKMRSDRVFPTRVIECSMLIDEFIALLNRILRRFPNMNFPDELKRMILRWYLQLEFLRLNNLLQSQKDQEKP